MPEVNPMEELEQDAMVRAATSMAAEAFLVREASRSEDPDQGALLLRAALVLTERRLKREAGRV